MKYSKSKPKPLDKIELNPIFVILAFSQLRFGLPIVVCPTPGAINPVPSAVLKL